MPSADPNHPENSDAFKKLKNLSTLKNCPVFETEEENGTVYHKVPRLEIHCRMPHAKKGICGKNLNSNGALLKHVEGYHKQNVWRPAKEKSGGGGKFPAAEFEAKIASFEQLLARHEKADEDEEEEEENALDALLKATRGTLKLPLNRKGAINKKQVKEMLEEVGLPLSLCETCVGGCNPKKESCFFWDCFHDDDEEEEEV